MKNSSKFQLSLEINCPAFRELTEEQRENYLEDLSAELKSLLERGPMSEQFGIKSCEVRRMVGGVIVE